MNLSVPSSVSEESVGCASPKATLHRKRRHSDPAPTLTLWLTRIVLLGSVRSSGALFRRRGPRAPVPDTDDPGQYLSEVAPAFLAHAGIPASGGRPEFIASVRRAQSRLARRVARFGWKAGIGSDFRVSLEAATRLLGLNEVESACLALAAALQANPTFRRLSFALGDELQNSALFDAFADVLELPGKDIRVALAKGSRLVDSQILNVDARAQSLADKFNWSAPSLPHAMFDPGFNALTALSDRVCVAPPPTLKWADYAHLGEEAHVLRHFLRHALESRSRGISVLIYGESGVGKTQLARLLAKELGCDLYEVAVEAEGEALDGMARLRTLRLMHSLFGSTRCMVFWDELEDLLPAPHPVFGPSLRTPQRKGLINQTLEEAPLITLFATNSIQAIDPAYLRRMTLCLGIKAPPQESREAKLKALPLALPEPFIRRLAACEHLSPAVVARAAEVAQAMPAGGEVSAVKAFEVVVNRSLEAQGKAHLTAPSSTDNIYHPDCLNASFCPLQLLAGLRRHPAARLLLTGVPGSGKSAFAIWLAQQLGRPAHVRRASDILSPYHAQTEINLARTFSDASRAGAVLILDEVEGFLGSRAQAVRQYEVQQTNEFLLQMESFDSILIGTTNLQTAMDEAARRRWDLIASLGYLKAEQARSLLARHLAAVGIPHCDESQLRRLDSLGNLAPGDYAAIARRNRFQPLTSVEDWIAALTDSSRAKPDAARRPIGFGSRSEAT